MPGAGTDFEDRGLRGLRLSPSFVFPARTVVRALSFFAVEGGALSTSSAFDRWALPSSIKPPFSNLFSAAGSSMSLRSTRWRPDSMLASVNTGSPFLLSSDQPSPADPGNPATWMGISWNWLLKFLIWLSIAVWPKAMASRKITSSFSLMETFSSAKNSSAVVIDFRSSLAV